MRLYIYKNGFCDPEHNIGIAKFFPEAKELDEYIKFFCASIDPKFISNWRIIIADDVIEWDAVDHFINFGEVLSGNNKQGIEEVNVKEIMLACNKHYQEIEKARTEARAKADKAADEFKARPTEPYPVLD